MNFYERELIVKGLFMRLREQPEGHVFFNPSRESASLILLLEGELSISAECHGYTVRRGECLYLPKGIKTRSTHLAKYNKMLIFYFQALEGEVAAETVLFPESEAVLSFGEEIVGYKIKGKMWYMYTLKEKIYLSMHAIQRY